MTPWRDHPRIAGGLLLATALVPSLWWIAVDKTVWPWDQAFFAEGSVDLWYGLIRHPAEYAHAFLHAGQIKPPAVIWLGQFFVPIGQAIRSVEAGLLLGIVLTQALAIRLAYLSSLRLVPGRRAVALCGAALVASAPLFVALTHQLFCEPLQLLCAAYVYWIAAAADDLRKERIAAHLLLAGALGLAVKTSTPIYCLLPAMYAALAVARRWQREKSFTPAPADRWLLAAGSALLLVTLGWYWVNLEGVRAHVVAAMSSGTDYGQIRSPAGKLRFWAIALQQAFVSLPVLALLAAILIGSFLRPRQPPPRALRWLALAAAAHCLYVLVLLSANTVEETRYLLALLPSAAILVVWLVSRLQSPAWARVVLACLVAQWAAVNAIASGWVDWPRGSLSNLIALPDKDPARMREVERVAAATSDPDGSLDVVGVEYPWLNANGLGFYSAKARLGSGRRAFYTSLGYAATDLPRAIARLRAIRPTYFISVDESAQPAPNFLNRLDLAVLQKFRTSPRYLPLPFDSALHIIIFRNRNGLDP